MGIIKSNEMAVSISCENYAVKLHGFWHSVCIADWSAIRNRINSE